MDHQPLPRLDRAPLLHEHLRRHSRFAPGTIWTDPVHGHRIGCLDMTDGAAWQKLLGDDRPTLAIHDPPYNLIAFARRTVDEYIAWCRQWIKRTHELLNANAACYVWMGADQRDGFQPLPEFMLMMRDTAFAPRSFITVRNQRGYGTQKNWMAVRQELLYYVKGDPHFDVAAEYTAIPRILQGYYKIVGGQRTGNAQRSHASTIRAGNVWVDIQQVFYRLEENVSGCYAQKPLSSIERIIRASSRPGDWVMDGFGHSGSTLLAAERLDRRCAIGDTDPVFCEIMARRLEHFQATGKTGWQHGNAFAEELDRDSRLQQAYGTALALEKDP